MRNDITSKRRSRGQSNEGEGEVSASQCPPVLRRAPFAVIADFGSGGEGHVLVSRGACGRAQHTLAALHTTKYCCMNRFLSILYGPVLQVGAGRMAVRILPIADGS
jgi:hypothetical protein